jgi:hypothetical protein
MNSAVIFIYEKRYLGLKTRRNQWRGEARKRM